MLAEGVVVEISGRKAWVQVERSGGCGRCSEPGGCGAEKRCARYLVDNACQAPMGALVAIEVPEGAALNAALFSYGLPLVGVLGGALAGAGFAAGVLAAPIGAAIGLLLAFAVLRGVQRSGYLRALTPRITSVIAS